MEVTNNINANETVSLDGSLGSYYSVYVPADVRQKSKSISSYVCTDRLEALKMIKKTKTARFKHFQLLEDAIKFAKLGVVDTNAKAEPTPAERNPFKGFGSLSPQDMLKLRKAIEAGDAEAFRAAIWTNPRYLVSSGDTPSIFQEGCRYNALHIAAKSKSGPIAELILSTISSPPFIQLLYGDDSFDIDSRIEVLVDLYLNTPDKSLNETPLHFAAKLGAVDVVEVLVSFPQCDRTLRNKYGQTPDAIVCDRCDGGGRGEKLRRIAALLANNYYVPVLRTEDSSLPALIGEPFSPGEAPRASADPLSPRMEIHAYAGPMNREGARQFRRVWKTPPRTSTPKRGAGSELDAAIHTLRFTDPSKGLERLGQRLASRFDVSWKEYWPFLDCFIDITSDDGLAIFENYLQAIHSNSSVSFDVDDGAPVSNGSLTDLCVHMQNCNLYDSIEEEDCGFSQFLCVERACNVFANRLAVEINARVDSFQFSLEVQTKQVELLVLSYMDDRRFNKINFGGLHPRLGHLTGVKLRSLLDEKQRGRCIEAIGKSFDCFSSDDEAGIYAAKEVKATSSKRQLVCLLERIGASLADDDKKVELDSEEVCKEVWGSIEPCSCVFRMRKARKFSRSNSFKQLKARNVAKELFVSEGGRIRGDESSSDEEEFFTPPSSPGCQSDEEYCEAGLLAEVFIEGGEPTRADCAVYKAFQLANCRIERDRHPNIYRWYRNVELYASDEREGWPQAKVGKLAHAECLTPLNKTQPGTATKVAQTPPQLSQSWLRITGNSSPRTSLHKLNV